MEEMNILLIRRIRMRTKNHNLYENENNSKKHMNIWIEKNCIPPFALKLNQIRLKAYYLKIKCDNLISKPASLEYEIWNFIEYTKKKLYNCKQYRNEEIHKCEAIKYIWLFQSILTVSIIVLPRLKTLQSSG